MPDPHVPPAQSSIDLELAVAADRAANVEYWVVK
jgi:hypothetical protein